MFRVPPLSVLFFICANMPRFSNLIRFADTALFYQPNHHGMCSAIEFLCCVLLNLSVDRRFPFSSFILWTMRIVTAKLVFVPWLWNKMAFIKRKTVKFSVDLQVSFSCFSFVLNFFEYIFLQKMLICRYATFRMFHLSMPRYLAKCGC